MHRKFEEDCIKVERVITKIPPDILDLTAYLLLQLPYLLPVLQKLLVTEGDSISEYSFHNLEFETPWTRGWRFEIFGFGQSGASCGEYSAVRCLGSI
jgi:hypothetical protein